MERNPKNLLILKETKKKENKAMKRKKNKNSFS